jgi:peptide/nickel transport system permease protein
MIYAGKDRLQDAWWIALMPAFVLFLTILSINLLGDVVAERFNIRDKIE